MKSFKEFIIEAQSKPTIDWMAEHYEKYNAELFNNELPKKIHLGLIRKPNDYSLGTQGFLDRFYCFKGRESSGMYQMYKLNPNANPRWSIPRRGKPQVVFSEQSFSKVTSCEELIPYINLNPKYQFSEYQKEDTMIHEMIHLWVSRNGLEPKRAHGKEFKAKCDEIRLKAEKLYGVKYQLTTYARHEKDESKDYQIDQEMQEKMKADIKKAAARGGGVVSVYVVFDKDKMPRETAFQIKLLKYTERFFFCTRNHLPKMLGSVAREKGVKHIYVSPTSYEKFVTKHGKIQTIQRYGKFWSGKDFVDDPKDNIFTEDAEDYMKVNEGLMDKLKNLLNKIIGAFVMIDKDTPSSEVDMEDLIEYADKNDNEEMKGDKKNDEKAIEIE